jgi:hypothetical protein
MKTAVRLACQTEVLEIPLARILPMRLHDESVRKSAKYACIQASIKELGLIEPLMVFPQPQTEGCFMLLDGHIRLMILKELGVTLARCLIATDDEGFTYNHKVNRLSAIQEHYMILRAIKKGLSEERIARSLHVDVREIRQRRDLLDGICPEAVRLLREKRVTGNALRELRKVKPMRQLEIAEIMIAAGNFSVGYVKCLVASTPGEALVEPERGTEARGLSLEEISRMEREMESLGREFKLIEETHGKNAVSLTVVAAYLKRLMDNARVSRYLGQHHPEIHAEFQKLVEARNLMDGAQAKNGAE